MSFPRDMSKSQLVAHVEQLRVHASMERMPVSKTIKDLIEHTNHNLQSDPFIFPVKENNFKEKRSCNIL